MAGPELFITTEFGCMLIYGGFKTVVNKQPTFFFSFSIRSFQLAEVNNKQQQ